MLLLAACAWISSDDLDRLADADGDGVAAWEDCDDGAAGIGRALRFVDADADGVGSGVPTCEDGADNADDCDDSDPEVGAPATWAVDLDGDGWGVGVVACEAPAALATSDGDCDDEDPSVNPGILELCEGEAVDQDCDGWTDDCELQWAGPSITGEPGSAVGSGLGAGDLDNNGATDMLLGDAGTGRAWVWTSSELDGPPYANHHTSDLLTFVVGTDASWGAGTSVAAVDIDDDGYLDALLGEPWNDGWNGRAGAVLVARGPLGAGEVVADFTLHGDYIGDGCGTVMVAGDLDDDGAQDLLLGTPDRTDGYGSAWQVFGPIDHEESLYDDGPYGTRRINGPGDDASRFGASVVVADLGEGPRSVIGAPSMDTDRTDAGAVYVCDDDEFADTCVVMTGASSGEQAGTSLAAGDLDGDGYDEVLVGAPFVDGDEADVGGVYVVAGEDVEDGELSALAETTLVGASDEGGGGGDAGAAVAIADLDGDGVPDLAVGAPGSDLPGADDDTGAVFLVHGPLSAGSFVLDAAWDRYFASVQGSRAGAVLTVAGDTDGDGRDDVLAGMPDQPGKDWDGAVALMLGASAW